MEAKESDQDLFIEVESTYRPYANAEEMDEAIKEHGSIVKHLNEERKSIKCYDDDEVTIGIAYSYEALLEYYIWLDGTPCGIHEGGAE